MSNEIEVYAGAQLEQLRNRGDIATTEDYRAVEMVARAAKKMINQADAQIDPEIKQAHLLHKSLLSKKKVVVEPLNEVRRLCSLMMGIYTTRIEKEEDEATREKARADAAVVAVPLIESGDLEAAASAIAHAENAPISALEKVDLQPANEGTITRTTYDFEIDPAKLGKAWMKPDEQKIRAAINKAKGEIEIKGVKITPITKTHVIETEG